MFLFVLNSINNPIPAPVNSPDSVAPRVIVLFIYSSVISILAPQFGISPTKLDKKYENIVFFMNRFSKKDSPRYSNIIFIPNENIIINNVILNVCFKADLIILWL